MSSCSEFSDTIFVFSLILCFCLFLSPCIFFFFFFNDTATTEIYTLSLHDALPIFRALVSSPRSPTITTRCNLKRCFSLSDRKSTRLNSSHSQISYAVFCLKKKKRARHSRGCMAFDYAGQGSSASSQTRLLVSLLID